MASALVAGVFDSESYWRDANLSRLPAIRDPEGERIVMAMEELLFPLCGSGGALLTRLPMEDAQHSYLTSIGFSFKRLSLGGEEPPPNIFEALACGLELGEELGGFSDGFSPFSIVPFAREAAAKCGFNAGLPSIETVKRVNSKIYSTLLTGELLGQAAGRPVYSSAELLSEGLSLLERHGRALIKDPFGVSGKGNMLVQSQQMLERTAAYIRKQEESGLATAFVLEPFLDVESDFSCQFDILPDGMFRHVSMQKMVNRQFAYQGSVSMGEEERQALEKAGYFNVMQQAAARLYRDGYFGPVCIDSMALRDGTLVPIVEINARRSMGFINERLDQALALSGKRGFMTYRSVSLRERFEYEAWLDELKNDGVLYPNRKGNGIIPLSSAALLVNAPSPSSALGGSGFGKGRLYMTIVAEDEAERKLYEEMLKYSLEQRGGKWHS